MTSIFPVIELVDRLAIAEIKFERTSANFAEVEWYRKQMENFNVKTIQSEIENLKSIHNTIWELESLLKSGRENELSLSEIGKRAIEIRDWNNKRIVLKNTIAEKLGCSVREIKVDHLSQ